MVCPVLSRTFRNRIPVERTRFEVRSGPYSLFRMCHIMVYEVLLENLKAGGAVSIDLNSGQHGLVWDRTGGTDDQP